MKRIPMLFALLACVVALAPPASAQSGRTDGSEESEFGKGGYPFGGPLNRFYANASFGSGFFSSSNQSDTRTGFLYGIDLGFEMDGWLGIQASYAYLSDRDMSIIGLGSRFAYTFEPFAYYASIDAGIYAPESGGKNFGLAPGGGIEIIINDRLRLGLDYRHDFIFTDTRTTDMNRVRAGLKFLF